MKENIGVIDSIVRIIIGFALIILSISGVIGAWGWVGVVPLLTGTVGRCPLYYLFRISTCGKDA